MSDDLGYAALAHHPVALLRYATWAQMASSNVPAPPKALRAGAVTYAALDAEARAPLDAFGARVWAHVAELVRATCHASDHEAAVLAQAAYRKASPWIGTWLWDVMLNVAETYARR